MQGRERVRTLHQSKDPNPTQPFKTFDIIRQSKTFKNEYNNTSQFFTSSRKISCSEKSFNIFNILYIFKTNGTELIDESADVC